MQPAKRLFRLVCLVLALDVAAVNAAERYYVITFTWEGNPPAARLSHSFATFIKVAEEDGQESIEHFTISWLPATLNIKLITRPEPGVNLGVRETFDFCRERGGEILGLGPYEIRKDLYDLALEQLRRLEAGRITYKAALLKMKWRPGAANCYYAVSDAAPRELLYLGTAWGHVTGVPVLEHFGPWLMDPAETHDDIIDRVGLRERNVRFRRIEDLAPNSRLLQQTVAVPQNLP